MPALKKSVSDMNDIEFRSAIKKNMEICGYKNMTELAKEVHMYRQTLWIKMRSPGKFTVEELRLLFRALKFSKEEKLTVI